MTKPASEPDNFWLGLTRLPLRLLKTLLGRLLALVILFEEWG